MTPRRSALLVLPALALTLTPVHADAATNHWKTVTSINGGKLQACRVPTAAKDPYKVRFRVNAVKASSGVQGMVTRWKGEKQLAGGWTSARIRPGHVSKVATVGLPRGTAYYLGAGINIGQAGNGGPVKPSDLPRC